MGAGYREKEGGSDRQTQTDLQREGGKETERGGRGEMERDPWTRKMSWKEMRRVGGRRGGREIEKGRRKWGRTGRETQRHYGRDGEAGRETCTEGDAQRWGGEGGSAYPSLDPGVRPVNEDVLSAPALPTWPPAFLVTQAVKRLVCSARDPGSIPGLGRCPGEGNGNSLQYTCLENPMDGGAWWSMVHGVTKSQT